MKPENLYADLLKSPSSNFDAVRDGRNAPDFYVDIALDVQGEQIIPVAGNSFYADANPMDGVCVVYFEDTTSGRAPTPFYVSPGFIARIPFTQIRVTWLSQPGKKSRLVYGVDTEFQPGSVSQVSFAGEVVVNDFIQANTQSFYITGASPIGFNVNTILAPGANLNGAVVKSVNFFARAGAGGQTTTAVMAAPTAPTVFAGPSLAIIGMLTQSFNNNGNDGEYQLSRRIPPGWGLYSVNESSVAAGSYQTSCSFFLL